MKRGPMRWVGVVVSAVFGVLFGLVLGAAVVAAIATTFFDYHVVVVASDSMQPDINKGDIVVTKRADTSKLKEGDVIFFSENGAPVLHRIAAIQKLVLNMQDKNGNTTHSATRYQYITKGDANPDQDSATVEGENVQGKLMWTIPGFGLIRDGTDPRVLMFTVAGAIAVLWIIWEASSRLLRLGRKRGDNAEVASPEVEWSPDSYSALSADAAPPSPERDGADRASTQQNDGSSQGAPP